MLPPMLLILKFANKQPANKQPGDIIKTLFWLDAETSLKAGHSDSEK